MNPSTALPPSHVIVLCAGLGERLRPLTAELPKPLLPVGDEPVLAHITRALQRAGYRSALANTHWMADKFEVIQSSLAIPLTLIHEVRIRGVAGGIAGARPQLESPVVSWNGDILLDEPPLGELVERVRVSSGVCLAVAEAQGEGTLGVDQAGRMVRVRGERFGEEVRAVNYVGLVALGSSALAELPEMGCLFGDYCMPLLRRGGVVETCLTRGAWSEVGSLRGYLEANRHWLRAHANHATGSYVAPSAQLDPGVVLQGSVVGARARVTGVGKLEGCVIWPDANVSVPLTDSVVTPRNTVRAAPSRA
jgi:mannose-1-phosphate guanylyltransferase